MKVAVIGCGYWGKHLLRNFYTSDKWELACACDSNAGQLEAPEKSYPGVRCTTNAADIFADPSVDAVAIATPVDSHFDLAKAAIEAGKHTWVEKPLTSSSAQANELLALAKKHNVLLHVDHTYIYTPAVRKIKQIIEAGELGDILYFDSVRVNLGLFQHDVNVIWDLAPHDISILEYCTGKKPVSVNATGSSIVKYSDRNLENIAYMTVNFEDNSIGHFHVNWLSPVKIRRIIIGGSRKMLVFNDMEPMEKIKIYDSGVSINSREDVYETLVRYRTGDMFSPAIDNKEALAEECNHFFDSIAVNKPTITSGQSGLYVVKILEAAGKSLKNNGVPVTIDN